MQETAGLFPNGSRRELARTLCENLDWHTPSGTCRERFCLRVPEELERLGVLTLPERRGTGGRRNAPARTEAGDPGEPIDAPLRDLEPVTLEIAAGGRELAERTGPVDRYHPRGCRPPIGCHPAYSVLDGSGRRLGCLMSGSAGALPVRGAWAGRDRRQRGAGLARVPGHSRFPVFPWPGVRNPASRSLSPAARRAADGWQRRRGVRPLLAETSVDPQEREGSRCRAAGWTEIGATASRAPKDMYALELEPDARAALRGERKGTERRPARAPESARTAAGMWSAAAAARTAERHDRGWRVRRRLPGRPLRPPPRVRHGGRLRPVPRRDPGERPQDGRGAAAGQPGDALGDVPGARQGRPGGLQGAPPGDPGRGPRPPNGIRLTGFDAIKIH